MIAVLTLVVVVLLSLVITRMATVALTLTGMSSEAARFQARSALTGAGFTTSESEAVVNHPVRRRIVLFLERPHWQTRVWVDDMEISTRDSLSTPHVHDLSDVLKPGEHSLTIRVDNRMIVDVGHNAHSGREDSGCESSFKYAYNYEGCGRIRKEKTDVGSKKSCQPCD